MTKEEELKQKRLRKLEEVHSLLEELGKSQKPFIHEGKEVDIVETIKVIYLICPRSITIFLERLIESVHKNPKVLVSVAKSAGLNLIYKH